MSGLLFDVQFPNVSYCCCCCCCFLPFFAFEMNSLDEDLRLPFLELICCDRWQPRSDPTDELVDVVWRGFEDRAEPAEEDVFEMPVRIPRAFHPDVLDQSEVFDLVLDEARFEAQWCLVCIRSFLSKVVSQSERESVIKLLLFFPHLMQRT